MAVITFDVCGFIFCLLVFFFYKNLIIRYELSHGAGNVFILQDKRESFLQT